MRRRPVIARRLVVTVLSLALTGAGLAPARPAHAGEPLIVFAALDVLVERHVDQPDPIRLLAAGLQGLRRALLDAGVADGLDDLSASQASAAREEFQARFDRAVVLAGGRLSALDLQYAAVRAMTASLGTSHTTFRDPDEWEAVFRARRNEASYAGIGTRSVVRAGRHYFVEVFPDGPAARAGVRPLDRVLAIDGRSTEGMTAQELSSRLRGTEGVPVTLTLQRATVGVPITVTLVRAPIVRPILQATLQETGVAVVRFGGFVTGSGAHLRRTLEDLTRRGMQGLVLDLRGNGGGMVVELVKVASALLPPGLLVSVRIDRRQARVLDITSGGPAVPPDLPMAVLIDETTVSAAEILAAALHDHGRAVLVGVRTAGAVLNSTDVPLPLGTGLQVPIRRIVTAKGAVLEGIGVRPGLVVVLSAADLDRGMDAQERRAVEWTAQRVAARRRGPRPATVPGPSGRVLPAPVLSLRLVPL